MSTERWKKGKPKVPGVYERDVPDLLAQGYARWDGKRWMRLKRTPEAAAVETHPSLFVVGREDVLWRNVVAEQECEVAA